MNRSVAKQIAETITNEQIKEMFETAKIKMLDWNAVSSVNKGMNKGAAWNILTKGFDVDKEIHILAKINMVREFGEFLPEELKPKKVKIDKRIVYYQDPIF